MSWPKVVVSSMNRLYCAETKNVSHDLAIGALNAKFCCFCLGLLGSSARSSQDVDSLEALEVVDVYIIDFLGTNDADLSLISSNHPM